MGEEKLRTGTPKAFGTRLAGQISRSRCNFVAATGCAMSLPAYAVTQLLKAWTAGDEEALDKIAPSVHEQLHQLAAPYIGWRALQTHPANDRPGQRNLSAAGRLQPTELEGLGALF